ncbi:MAG: hypothetical protein ABJG78_07765 [Cyclobacteriaceae bacterium]
MLVSFDQMPDTSRLWIYQAERKLTGSEQDLIDESTSQFLKAWTAHGSNLKASFELMHDQFLVLTLDENVSQASGCSIDSSVNHIQSLERSLGISLINNDKVAFLIGNKVELLPAIGLKGLLPKKNVNPSTKVFNNTVQTLGDFKSNWFVESGQTWVNRFF